MEKGSRLIDTDKHIIDISTSGTQVEVLITWLKDELKSIGYGEVGLLFGVVDNKITIVDKIYKKTYKI